jgi:hypothetical protein
MEQLKDSAIAGVVGLAIPLAIMATVFAWNIPQTTAVQDRQNSTGPR